MRIEKKSFALILIVILPLIYSHASFASSVQYQYDNLHRLISAQYDDGTTIQYTYDAMGNRTSKVLTVTTTSSSTTTSTTTTTTTTTSSTTTSTEPSTTTTTTTTSTTTTTTTLPCTTPPDVPSLSSPSDGATNVSSSGTLTWGAVADATSYDVQICSDSGCSSVVTSASGLTATHWTVSPALNKNTTYSWRVEANNGCGSSAWTSPWSFTTGNCFIATAAFGTPEQGKIDVLRSFRDTYLIGNPIGKAFVEAYYSHSPPAAEYIAHREWLRTVVRVLLTPVIGFISLFV